MNWSDLNRANNDFNRTLAPGRSTEVKETDETLITKAQSGDAVAFRAIVEQYQRDVLITVIGIVGDGDDVADIVQEVFIRLHKSLGKFEGRSTLKTYLTRIAVNLSLDGLRRRKRNQARQTSLDQVAAYKQFADTDLSDQKDNHDIVWGAIDQLPEKYRPVVVLRMIDGYSTQEAADILGVKYGTVLSRLSRAMEKMKELLEPEMYPQRGN